MNYLSIKDIIDKNQSADFPIQQLPNWQQEIILKVINKVPELRFQFMIELDEALKAKSVPIIFNKNNLKAAELIKLADKAWKTNKWRNTLKYIDLANKSLCTKVQRLVLRVKGQTHCATMYVETAYKKTIYETLKLKEPSKNLTIRKRDAKTIPLFKQTHSCETPSGIEALKMMYVGFSRPTHLLCFAVLEENVKDDLEKFKNAGWKIVDDLVTIDSKSNRV